MLRDAGPRSALCRAAQAVDRLVLLGDVLELRHGPMHQALAQAEPVLRELGAALSGKTEVILVPGNHDYRLLAPWLERRALAPEPLPLGSESEIRSEPGEPLAELARWLEPAAVRVAYPGVWLRDDVYATHGHYSDRHHTVPILERLGAGAMARIAREPAGGPWRAEDYETTLRPMY